jgi:hypothetical protein
MKLEGAQKLDGALRSTRQRSGADDVAGNVSQLLPSASVSTWPPNMALLGLCPMCRGAS